jgi:hypothetical protein
VFSNDVLDAFRFDVWSLERIALLGAGGAFISILLRIPDFTGLSAAQVNTQFYPASSGRSWAWPSRCSSPACCSSAW